MKEYKPKYNPADYAAIKAEAKAMDRKELEEAFVKIKDSKHIALGEGIALIALALALMALGAVMQSEIMNIDLKENAKVIEREVCPHYNGKIILQEYSSHFNSELIEVNCKQ